ncbi:MAG TPA: hypothetical protein VJN89_07565 [Candidatus Acidoferrum sp.]|nr:hypothetical protein [Candidatus Acidoferrum sp.]
MPSRFAIVSRCLFALLLFPLFALAQSQVVRQIPLTRSGPIPPAAPPSANALAGPELDSALVGDDADGGDDDSGQSITINRTIAKGPGAAINHGGNLNAKSNPELMLSMDGINHFQQRFVAGGGNQFSIEPPDQGLCAGNGFVLETVNDTLRIFDTAGNAVTAPTALNDFYQYAPAFNRANGANGPSITDPSCLFDTQTQRWFHVVLTLDRINPSTQSLSGKNHLDVAVSATADPTGAWNFYSLPVQDDGTDGTPDHGCQFRSKGVLVHGPCLGDYPHIGADAHGFYITTNEFNFFSPGFFHGAQIYALSKSQLAAGAGAVNVVQFNTADPSLGLLLEGIAPGFTVWPATSTGNQFEGGHGGTEYFLSSDAVFTANGTANWVRLWSVTNTNSLDTFPALGASFSVVPTMDYSIPAGNAVQKAGNVPLATCLGDSSLQITATLFGCWRLVTGGSGPFPNAQKKVNVNDSRMQQVALANGKLWASLDTWLTISGDTQSRAGVAYFVINPNAGKVEQQGNVGILGNNLSYPAIAVTQSGRGVMAFTVLGNDHYPSAGYTGIDAIIGAGDIHIAAEGMGPDDGFTGYNPTAAFGTRPRWGDYGAAASDGNTIWIGSEYINQTCDYNTFLATNFRCGNTRTQLANWGTRISKIVP